MTDVFLEDVANLEWQTPIVEPMTGRPDPQFIKMWQQTKGNIKTLSEITTDTTTSTSSTFDDWSVNPLDYGYVGDGTTHPLSEVYDTLEAAQSVYDFATALTQEIDYCSLKKAANVAFGGDLNILTDYILCGSGQNSLPMTQVQINDGAADMGVDQYAGYQLFVTYASSPGYINNFTIVSNTARIFLLADNHGGVADNSEYAIGRGEHGSSGIHQNRRLIIPAGDGFLGDDTLLIRNLAGGIIEGRGREVSRLRGRNTVLAFDGIWYSRIEGITFAVDEGLTDKAVVELDGNIPGHDYATRGVQATRFVDCNFNGRGLSDGEYSTYAFAQGRQGGGGAQGDGVIYDNCHWSGANYACHYQNGFNALCNMFIGGDMQDYFRHGLYAVGGTFGVYNMTFECIHHLDQLLNEGADVRCGDSGSYDACIIQGVRSESLCVVHNEGAVLTDVRACTSRASTLGWYADYLYDSSTSEVVLIPSLGRVYRAITTGTSGGTEPTWPVDGTSTVSDGSIVWQEITFYSFYMVSGSYDPNTCSALAGTVKIPSIQTAARVDYDWTVSPTVNIVFVDASGGDITINSPWPVPHGRQFTVKRVDGTATNDVTVYLTSGFEDGASTVTLAPLDAMTFAFSQSDITNRWFLI